MSMAGNFACGLALACVLSGCKAPELPAIISPYRMDIQQGNVVTQDMISKLKAGMTRSQVRFVLGSPLIVDPFRTDRWDYVSIYEKQGKEVERRRVTVIFEADKLVRIEGDVVASDGSLKKDQPVEKPPVAGKVLLDPAKPVTFSKPAPAPNEPSTAVVTKPAAAAADGAGQAAPAGAAKAAPTAPAADGKKDDAANKDAPADKAKEPGFFSRMLEKLGM